MKRVALSLILLAAMAALPVLAGAPGGGAAAGPGAPGGRGGRAGRGGGAPASSTLTQPRASPHDAINTRVGGDQAAMVTIYYGRPYSKPGNTGEARKIWGGLVPWEQVWRMGSDEATTMITQKDLVFGTLVVPAGAYTLCMLPSEKGTSKLIINKQIGQWGIPYTPAIEKNELGRVDMTKEPDVDPQVDQLTLSLSNANGGSVLKVTWEKSVYSVAFKVKQ